MKTQYLYTSEWHIADFYEELKENLFLTFFGGCFWGWWWFLFFFNYSIINLQYCITFTCTAKWLGYTYICIYGFPGGSVGKESACNTGDLGSIPGSGRSLKKEMATHSSIIAWRFPWTEGPGRLQSMDLQRIEHNLVTKPQQL